MYWRILFRGVYRRLSPLRTSVENVGPLSGTGGRTRKTKRKKDRVEKEDNGEDSSLQTEETHFRRLPRTTTLQNDEKKVRRLLVFECCSPGQGSLAMQDKPTVEKSKSSFLSSSPFSPFLLRPQSAVPLPSPPPPLLSPWGLVYQYKQNYPIEKRREKWGEKVRAKEGRERR